MNCPQCKIEMVLTKATSFGSEYYYCRPCKKELSQMSPPEVDFKVKPGESLTIFQSMLDAMHADIANAFRDSLICGVGKIKIPGSGGTPPPSAPPPSEL